MLDEAPDFLVIGAGVAGLRAAIELAPAGRVLVLTKDSLRESSSEYAQGGIAVVLSDDDELYLHEQDTIFAGDGLCDAAAVKTLVEEGPAVIQQLIDWGTEFDRDGSKLLFAREGAHSRNRVLHSHGDSTGHEIARPLYRKAASLANVEFRSYAAMTDLLLTPEGEVAGVAALDEPSGKLVEIHARGTLLATGGLGRVFEETTNPDVATGDGVAAAYRAGTDIADIEFVQFHPTALHVSGAPRFLLSEALRGEGGQLLNEAGERFMQSYHPLKELAPRDVVSRAIVMEIQRTGAGHVYLDVTHVDRLPARFPRIYETCLRYGIDLAKQPAPVHPAAHYAMGGVRTDLNGKATLPRLFAAGEAACTGVHGANRLASNSLLEGVVFGARAGRPMRECTGTAGDAVPLAKASFPDLSEAALRRLTWDQCGILRDESNLKQALALLRNTRKTDSPPAAFGVSSSAGLAPPAAAFALLRNTRKTDSPPAAFGVSSSAGLAPPAAAFALLRGPQAAHPYPDRADYERRNIHAVAGLIAKCALAREESRGAHYRIDFPQKRAEFQKHSLIARDRDARFS